MIHKSSWHAVPHDCSLAFCPQQPRHKGCCLKHASNLSAHLQTSEGMCEACSSAFNLQWSWLLTLAAASMQDTFCWMQQLVAVGKIEGATCCARRDKLVAFTTCKPWLCSPQCIGTHVLKLPEACCVAHCMAEGLAIFTGQMHCVVWYVC